MRFRLDPQKMLARCHRLQWSVDDIDWNGPGVELVSEEQRDSLRAFMIDLYWIEYIAARVFAVMAEQSRDATLRGIFGSFSADEQRHADAELGLMKRWKMVARHETPEPNLNARNLLRALEKGAARRVHPAVFSAIIPFTELVLDGALVKHLEETIDDPVCTEVFRLINRDEARHLAVDFYVLEQEGKRAGWRSAAATVRTGLNPMVAYALFLGYLPLLLRMRPNILRTGLSEQQIALCVKRYIAIGDQSPAAARHPAYRLFRWLSKRIVQGRNEPLEFLLRLSDVVDRLGITSSQPAPA